MRFVFLFVFFACSFADDDTNCTVSSPWSTCACPTMDLPIGVSELVTSFIPNEMLTPLLNNVMEELCEGNTTSEISNYFADELYLMANDDMKKTLAEVNKELEKCLQPDSSVKQLIDPLVQALEYSLQSYREVMHSFAATFDSPCSSIIDEMYGKLCPAFIPDLIQSVLSHIRRRLGMKAFGCLKEHAMSLVHFEKYKI